MTASKPTDDENHEILNHWAPPGASEPLSVRVLDALKEAGHDLNELTLEDLAPVDEFHIRGREGTLEMLEIVEIDTDTRVLDVGSGLGGPSRILADRFGCSVTGIDLTPDYCELATILAERIGLSDRVQYQVGNALDLPFEDATFDLVWTQHVSMNIQDKRTMFSEMRRVLRPHGRLAIYDPIGGNGEPLHLPVPWARTPEINFLIDTEDTKAHLEGAGFEIREWRDVSEKSAAFFRKAAENAQSAERPVLGFHLYLGEDTPAMMKNMRRNIEEGRVAVIQLLAERRD